MARLTRRDVLRTAGLTLAASAAARLSVLAQAPGSVMRTLSAYMTDAAGRALPSEVLEHATHHILDTFAAMISGSELAPGQAWTPWKTAHTAVSHRAHTRRLVQAHQGSTTKRDPRNETVH